MAEKLVPLTGFEPVTPSLRTRGFHGNLRVFRQNCVRFGPPVPFLFPLRSVILYICTSGSTSAPTPIEP